MSSELSVADTPMDEAEFKQTYNDYNDRPCVFAKALLAHCAGCGHGQKLNIAEREAMACRSANACNRCGELHEQLYHNALFALRLTHMAGQLPHGKEMKVQCGGLLGIAHVMDEEHADDIAALLDRATARYGGLAALPYGDIVKFIVAYQLRKRSSDRPAT